MAELIIDGPGLASSLIVAATRAIEKPLAIPAKAPAVKNVLVNTWDDLMVFGNRVDHSLGNGRAVEGVVTDLDTGQPLAGFVVHGPWRSPLEYHEYDRFQYTPMNGAGTASRACPTQPWRFHSGSPPDRPYLGRMAQVESKQALARCSANSRSVEESGSRARWSMMPPASRSGTA